MSCDICNRGSCCPSFHSGEEQRRFKEVIAAFNNARKMREELNQLLDREAEEGIDP